MRHIRHFESADRWNKAQAREDEELAEKHRMGIDLEVKEVVLVWVPLDR